MKVEKSTWVQVGTGTPADIMTALHTSRVPAKAKAVEIMGLGMVQEVSIRFDWEDEE